MSADTNPGNGGQGERKTQTPVEVARGLVVNFLENPDSVSSDAELLMAMGNNDVLLTAYGQAKLSRRDRPGEWMDRGIAYAFLYFSYLARARNELPPTISSEAFLGVGENVNADVKSELMASEFMTSDSNTERYKGVRKIYLDTDRTLINSMMAVCIDPKWRGAAPFNTRSFLDGGVLVDRLVKRQAEINKGRSNS